MHIRIILILGLYIPYMITPMETSHALSSGFDSLSSFFKDNPTVKAIFDHRDPELTVIYSYDPEINAFLQQGNLNSLTAAQAQEIIKGNYMYDRWLGKYKQKSFEELRSFSAILLTKDPGTCITFSESTSLHTYYRNMKQRGVNSSLEKEDLFELPALFKVPSEAERQIIWASELSGRSSYLKKSGS